MAACLQTPAFGGRVPAGLGSSGMFHDIWETPEVMRRLLEKNLQRNGDAPRVDIQSLSKPLGANHAFAGKTPLEVMAACRLPDGSFQNKITIIGCGSSYHVASLAEYLIETIARVPVEVTYGSEYRYRNSLHRKGDVLVAISSSGETLDTLESIRNLRSSQRGSEVLTVAIVNEVQSSAVRETDGYIETLAGKEVGIASTKVFSSSMLACVLLAIALGDACGTLSKDEQQKLLTNLQEMPDLVQMVLDREALPLKVDADQAKSGESSRPLMIGDCQLWDIGCQNVLANNFIFLGRGFNFPIALEGAMKCKELAYIHAEGYPAAEMKHGPIALIDQFMPVVVIAPRSDPTYDKIKANIEEVQTRSGSVIVITEDYNSELEKICEFVIKVPSTHEYFMPLISAIPMQLLAYMMGVLRGNEVDNPRGLEKTVSKEALPRV